MRELRFTISIQATNAEGSYRSNTVHRVKPTSGLSPYQTEANMSLLMEPFQGSYRQILVKFKDFSRTSKDYPIVFKD